MTPLRVVLVDDHTMFREGIARVLISRAGAEVVGRGSHGRDAVALVERHKPDVVITQVEHHLKRAGEILAAMRLASANSRIVVLTMFDNLHYVRTLSRLGIDAYVHKSSSIEELLAIVSALSRNPEGDNVVVSMPRDSLERIGDGHESALSDRELEVLVLVARGISNRQVATQLHISEATVKRHLANIYQKIGVRSRSDAVRIALAEQWIGFHEIISAYPPRGLEWRRKLPWSRRRSCVECWRSWVRGWVNKGKKKGRELSQPRPSQDTQDKARSHPTVGRRAPLQQGAL